MKVIGLTGGTGSGKGIVGAELQALGAVVIDSDKVAHEIILKGTPAYKGLKAYFGETILGEDGEINRRRLGEIVFNHPEKLAFLNRCTHKYIFEALKRKLDDLEKEGTACAVIDAPLLLEGNFRELCHEIWVVYAGEEKRLERIVARDGISRETAKNRIASQISFEEYQKAAHVVIDNDGDGEQIREQVLKYYKI